MNTTRLMDRLFSATEKSESSVLDMMEKDFSTVLQKGTLETGELIMRAYSDGSIEITDKETGEKTLAEPSQDEEGNAIYDLSPVEEPTEQLEGELHPEVSEDGGVESGEQTGTPDEHVEEHMSPEQQMEAGVNPKAGNEPTVEENAEDEEKVCPECGKNPCECEDEDDEKEYSITTDNVAILRIFSDQEFCERIFSEVIESEETAKVGDLKVEKLPDEENAVVVTSESTGDQAKVTLKDDEMEVTELESKTLSKSFSEDEDEDVEEGEEEEAMEDSDEDDQYLPYFIVGVEPFNHIIASTCAYDTDDAQEIARRLTEDGVSGVRILEDEDEARDYANELLEGLDATEVEDEPEEATYSDMEDNVIYFTKFYTDTTYFMDRCFSETVEGVSDMQDALEDVIENQKEVEEGDTVVTPINDTTAVVSEGDEFTKITLEDEDKMSLENISKEEYEDLIESSETEDQKVYSNHEETKFFSENEYLTNYMQRLFTEDASEEDIEEAIENQETKEVDDNTTIIPVSETEAIVKDESGDEPEYSLAVLDDETVDVNPIDAEKAEDMIEEKEYSGIYCDDAETKFFSENEYLTNYMQRLFTDASDSAEIEEAIEEGKVKENNTEKITPIDDETAIIEDKENGEFTKATIDDETVDVEPIDEDEAKELIDNKEKTYTYVEDPLLDKFFTDALGVPQQDQQPEVVPAVVDPNTGQLVPYNPEEEGEKTGQPQLSVEAIEDKALAAIQSIQAAVNEGEAQILNAKAAPVENQEQNLQEAQFSESDIEPQDTLLSWLDNNIK